MEKKFGLRHLFAILVILAVAAIAQTALAASTIDKYRQYSGDYVSIYWNGCDSCSCYYFSFGAWTNASRNNAPPAQAAQMSIENYDYCRDVYSVGWSEANPDWFKLVVQNTKTASLKGNIPMQWATWGNTSGPSNFSGNAVVDLQWKGNGTPQRSTDSSTEHSLNFMRSYRSSGLSVPAAVSGSITLDGNPYPLSQYAMASIFSSVTSEMTIVRSAGPPPTGSPQARMLMRVGDVGANRDILLTPPMTAINSSK